MNVGLLHLKDNSVCIFLGDLSVWIFVFKSIRPLILCSWFLSFLRNLLSVSLDLSYFGCAFVLCWSQPVGNQCCHCTGPCVSYYDCKIPSAITIRKPLKIYMYCRSWKLHGTHYTRIERESAHGPGVCFHWGSEWGPRFHGLTLYWWI